MADSLAIGNLGNYYNDPYFWQAYNYQPQGVNLQGVNPQGVNLQGVNGINPAVTPEINPEINPQMIGSYVNPPQTGYENIVASQQDSQASKKKSRAGLLLTSVAMLVAGIVCHKNGTGDKFIPRLIDGGKKTVKNCINSVKNKISETGKKINKSADAENALSRYDRKTSSTGKKRTNGSSKPSKNSPAQQTTINFDEGASAKA